jgi:hypothetical protein
MALWALASMDSMFLLWEYLPEIGKVEIGRPTVDVVLVFD